MTKPYDNDNEPLQTAVDKAVDYLKGDKMETMIERVAKAIHNYRTNKVRVCTWQDCSESYRIELRLQAKAAIAAMREPTEEMINAFNEYGDKIHYIHCSMCGGAKETWPAMIDAALKE